MDIVFLWLHLFILSVVISPLISSSILGTYQLGEFIFQCPIFLPFHSARRSNQSILKEISPEYSVEGLMLKLKLQYFGHLMWRTDSLEKTLMLGKTEGGRRKR